jgi:hypothetical protein
MPVVSNPNRASRSALALAIGAVLVTSVATAAETAGTLEVDRRHGNEACRYDC